MSYNPEIIKAANEKLNIRRETSINEAEKRRAEIYEKIPRYYELKKEMLALIGDYINKLGSTECDTNSVKARLKENIDKRKQLLVDNGYPENYTDDKFFCEKCSDKGYIGSQQCECFKQLLIETAAAASNLNCVLSEVNFSNFDLKVFSDKKSEEGISPKENMKKIISGVKTFIDGFDSDTVKSMIFIGKAGVGKTYLASCIAKKIIDEGFDVYYQSAGRITELIEDYRFKRNLSDNIAYEIERLYSCDLLIIDDLGSEFTNTYTVSIFYELINKRLMNRKKMIITTNHSIDDLNRVYTERLFSRFIGEFDLYEFIGDDLRIKNSLNNHM